GVQPAHARFIDAVEPPRTDWFLAGTQPADTPTRSRAPRIVAPSDGALIAPDPDIPGNRQRVPFTAEAVSTDARWLLDGHDLGAIRDVPLWAPTRGRHVLELVVGEARPLDR